MTDLKNNAAPGVAPGCTRCAYSVPVRLAGDIRTKYQCRVGPPMPIPALVKDGQIGCKTGRGFVTDEDWCFQFAPRGESN